MHSSQLRICLYVFLFFILSIYLLFHFIFLRKKTCNYSSFKWWLCITLAYLYVAGDTNHALIITISQLKPYLNEESWQNHILQYVIAATISLYLMNFIHRNNFIGNCKMLKRKYFLDLAWRKFHQRLNQLHIMLIATKKTFLKTNRLSNACAIYDNYIKIHGSYSNP